MKPGSPPLKSHMEPPSQGLIQIPVNQALNQMVIVNGKDKMSLFRLKGELYPHLF